MNEFLKGALLNREIIIAAKLGQNLDRFPLFHAPNTPTVRGAIVLAQAAGIRVEHKQTHTEISLQGVIGKTFAFVWVTGASMASAGISSDPLWGEEIATGLAFRNAIEKMCCLPIELGKHLLFGDVIDAVDRIYRPILTAKGGEENFPWIVQNVDESYKAALKERYNE